MSPKTRSTLARILLATVCALAATAAPAADPPKDNPAAADAAQRDATPTPEQCKAGYPPGAQVAAVETIAAREIAAAQAAQAAGEPDAKDGANHGNTSKAGKPTVELRQGLKLKVARLPALLDLQNCPGKKRALVLFLAGRPMPGLTAYPPTDPAHETILFLLERTAANADAWTTLLGRPAFGTAAVNVSVGFEDSYPIPSSETIRFRAIPARWAAFWAVVTLAFAALVLWAARSTAMLRDGSNRTAMFSLARVQLTFWTFLVLGSFMFIGMITGDYLNSMNENVLALMGISVGTALGSSVIDGGSVNAVPRQVYATTGSWWRDILSDGTDVSIHRFQMAAWTIVLGIVFLHQVYSRLSMPQLPAELLGLMGISAGAYLGLKATAEK